MQKRSTPKIAINLSCISSTNQNECRKSRDIQPVTLSSILTSWTSGMMAPYLFEIQSLLTPKMKWPDYKLSCSTWVKYETRSYCNGVSIAHTFGLSAGHSKDERAARGEGSVNCSSQETYCSIASLW